MKNFKEFQEATRLAKETGTLIKGGTKKPTTPKQKDTALDLVKKSITAQYGKGAIMNVSGSRQPKKVPGKKNPNEGGKFLKQHQAKQQLKKEQGKTVEYTYRGVRYEKSELPEYITNNPYYP